jgi:hypothetical protein
MKKKLDIEKISNELEGASLFFTKTPSSPPLQSTQITKDDKAGLSDSPTAQDQSEKYQAQKRTNDLSYVRPYERTSERTITPKPKRQKIRHAFDIYMDQLISLQVRQLEAVQKGKKKPKLGKMVQDAIDQYLKKDNNQAQKRTNDRTDERTNVRTNEQI